MKHAAHFTLHPGWKVLLTDAGISVPNVLRRAGMPEDLLSRSSVSLSALEYCRLWTAIEEEAADPTLPIRLGTAISVEVFDAPIFAAFCSPDLNTAMRRLRRYKPLIAPIALHVDETSTHTGLEIEWLDRTASPPASLALTELVFFVQLARIATRERICPVDLSTPLPPDPMDPYRDYFGCPVGEGDSQRIRFAAADAARPFLTANERMWQFFEPELRKRLCELDERATFADRVRGALLELLPGGPASLAEVSRKLAVSTRTLQRRLREERQSFQGVLNATREELARHYLTSSSMSGAEISFLLGFEEPSSFFRAFHTWTGKTPEQVRLSASGPAVH